MDIARDPKPKTRRRIIQWSVATVAAILITVALRNLQPAAPSVDAATVWVDAATVWMDTVMHGTMVRQVRGPGTLVPEQMRWVTALTAGRVEQIVVLPGTVIEENTVIIRAPDGEARVDRIRVGSIREQPPSQVLQSDRVRSCRVGKSLRRLGAICGGRVQGLGLGGGPLRCGSLKASADSFDWGWSDPR